MDSQDQMPRISIGGLFLLFFRAWDGQRTATWSRALVKMTGDGSDLEAPAGS
jgi:hypothetical protein